MKTQNLFRSPGMLVVAALAMLTVAGINTAQAQSGSRYTPPRSTATPPSTSPGSGSRAVQPSTSGSGSKSMGMEMGSGSRMAAPLSLSGYCPVCVVEKKAWVKGSPNFAAKHDGRVYHFPDQNVKDMFVQNPGKYAPILGGDCIVALVEHGKRVKGTPQFASFHDGRLYLFANQQAKAMFEANRSKYVGADLALNGNCIVCQAEMQQIVAGKPEFTSVYKGLRYQFPAAQQQQMFDANPAKYAVSQ